MNLLQVEFSRSNRTVRRREVLSFRSEDRDTPRDLPQLASNQPRYKLMDDHGTALLRPPQFMAGAAIQNEAQYRVQSLETALDYPTRKEENFAMKISTTAGQGTAIWTARSSKIGAL